MYRGRVRRYPTEEVGIMTEHWTRVMGGLVVPWLYLLTLTVAIGGVWLWVGLRDLRAWFQEAQAARDALTKLTNDILRTVNDHSEAQARKEARDPLEKSTEQ
jgi:hypothetical protein